MGEGPAGVYNLAGEGVISLGDVARSIGWHAVPAPGPAVELGAAAAGRLGGLAPRLEWAIALGTPVLMDTAKARRDLGWEPHFDARETLLQTAIGAREAGLLD